MTRTAPAADGTLILTQLRDILTRYVILPTPEAAVAVALGSPLPTRKHRGRTRRA